MEKDIYKKIPGDPGVYIMKDKDGNILYIGKAANLNKRVRSYFIQPHDRRIETLVKKIEEIDYKKTDSALDALVLEAHLIKKHEPPFNIKEKDDKSFLFVEITREKFPRVLLTRGKEKKEEENKGKKSKWYGPFTSASDIREALRILRKIFPYNTHPPQKIGTFKRPCMYAEIGLCPGACVGKADEKEYKKTIRELEKVLKGKKKGLIGDLKKEMKEKSKAREYEKAEEIKRKVFALEHIQDSALISRPVFRGDESNFRIEGYDISNISGASSVGSMVVFSDDRPDKNEYRKFKIRTIKKQDDTGMIKEVLERRFNHDKWQFPDLILIDGGKGQVNAVKNVLSEKGLSIPVVGIAKGPKRDKNEIIGSIPEKTNKKTLIKVRDEAHRFAISYHKKVRRRQFRK